MPSHETCAAYYFVSFINYNDDGNITKEDVCYVGPFTSANDVMYRFPHLKAGSNPITIYKQAGMDRTKVSELVDGIECGEPRKPGLYFPANCNFRDVMLAMEGYLNASMQ